MMRRYLSLLVLTTLFLSLSCTVVQAEGWVERSDAPCSGGYGEAVVGTTENIYVARCLYATSTPSFSRYDPDTDSWTSMSASGLPSGAFRSGTALAWDHDNHIYTLCGGRYSDSSRTLFYRYSISGNNWEQLADTPHAQGAGDAITWSEHDDQVYAMIGSNARGTVFARYNYNSWETLTFNPNWTFTDDGASLVSVGEYLYALRGEYDEHTSNGDFARYHTPTATWTDMSDIPESEGVGDGGSLLYIGDWASEHEDYIFALGGGGVYEDPGYNFYRYNISGNDWEQSEQIPCPIGYYVGNRLGYANNNIYYWQGSPPSDLWICGGDAFYMYGIVDDLKGDLNGDGQVTVADVVIALQMTASGEHNDAADMNDDMRVTSVDALMILHEATSTQTKWKSSDEGVISYLDAGNYIGQTKTVEGTIVRTFKYTQGNIIFLNFHDPYQGYFTAIIWSSDWDNFPFAPEIYYNGKEVRVTGEIIEYKGTPEIVVRDPSQIEVAFGG